VVFARRFWYGVYDYLTQTAAQLLNREPRTLLAVDFMPFQSQLDRCRVASTCRLTATAAASATAAPAASAAPAAHAGKWATCRGGNGRFSSCKAEGTWLSNFWAWFRCGQTFARLYRSQSIGGPVIARLYHMRAIRKSPQLDAGAGRENVE
jgi:hypothetical protein